MAITKATMERQDRYAERRVENIEKVLGMCHDWTPVQELIEACGYSHHSSFVNVLTELIGYGLVRFKADPNDPDRKKSRYLYKSIKTFNDYLAMKEAEALRSKQSRPVLLLGDNSEYVEKVKATARLHAKSTVNRIGKSSILGVDFVS